MPIAKDLSILLLAQATDIPPMGVVDHGGGGGPWRWWTVEEVVKLHSFNSHHNIVIDLQQLR